MGRWVVLACVIMAGCAGRPSPVTFPLAGPSLAPTWTGTYECAGRASNGQPYRVALIIAPSGDGYDLLWRLPGGIVSIGAALPLDSILVVAYYTGQAFGPAIYRWEDGRLVGRWAAWGAHLKIFTEVCGPTSVRIATR